jgi:chemotaxis protein MotB
VADGLGNGNPPVIRIVRKKQVVQHHSGAWKVAYADFVTALMAFFLVMWIVGLSKPVREAIEAYFKDPIGFSKAVRHGQSPFASGDAMGILTGGAAPVPTGKGSGAKSKEERLREVQQAIVDEMERLPEFRSLRESVAVKLTKEGLRIELIEKRSSLFFDSGSAVLKPHTRQLLSVIAKQLREVNNPIVIEGHTDSRPLVSEPHYSNWELSSDRANAARRAMEASGLLPGQVLAVRGYADRKPLRPKEPHHFSNRRVSILVAYTAAGY